jgi:predicted Fe-Mo cluster-binding NifX family protein
MKKASCKSQEMIAAIASDDHETLSKSIFGRARYFEIYRITPEQMEHVESRSNSFADTFQHGKTFDVMDFLSDCQLMVAHRIGKKGVERMKAAGLRCLETEPRKIEELIHAIRKQGVFYEVSGGGESR